MPRPALSDGEVYARSLLPRCRGYPLWIPEPFGAIAEYQSVGVRIGDVGYVTEDGAFETFFNVRVEADHPLNKHGVPEDFVPLHLDDELHVSVVTGAIQERASIFSDHAKETVVGFELSSLGNPALPVNAGAGLAVRWNSREGAIVHLPKGASHTRSPPSLFRKYALRHARSWYHFVNDVLDREIPSGSLYLVTAFDKCDAWMVGAFFEAGAGHDVALHIGAFGIGQGGVSQSYNWYNTHSPACRIGPTFPSGQRNEFQSPLVVTQDLSVSTSRVEDTKNTPLGRNQSLFIKGYTIALRRGWNPLSRKDTSHVSLIENTKPNDIPRLGLQPSSSSLFRRSSKDDESRSQGTRSPHPSPGDNQENGTSPGTPSADTVTLDFQPNTELAFHPAMALNQYLLEAAPDAEVALTHDDDWCALGKMDSSTATSEFLRKYLVVENDGAYFDEALSHEEDRACRDLVTDPTQVLLPLSPATSSPTSTIEVPIEVVEATPLVSFNELTDQDSSRAMFSPAIPPSIGSGYTDLPSMRHPSSAASSPPRFYTPFPFHKPLPKDAVSSTDTVPSTSTPSFQEAEDNGSTQYIAGSSSSSHENQEGEPFRQVSFAVPPVTRTHSVQDATVTSFSQNTALKRPRLADSEGDYSSGYSTEPLTAASSWSAPPIEGSQPPQQAPETWSRSHEVGDGGQSYPAGTGYHPPCTNLGNFTPHPGAAYQIVETPHEAPHQANVGLPVVPTNRGASTNTIGEPPTAQPSSLGFALICGECFAHNGLLPQSTWEKTGYFCPRCNHHNAPPSIPQSYNRAQNVKKAAPVTTNPSGDHDQYYGTRSKPQVYDTSRSPFAIPDMKTSGGPALTNSYYQAPATARFGANATPLAPTILHPTAYTPQPVYSPLGPWGAPSGGYPPQGPTSHGSWHSLGGQVPYVPPHQGKGMSYMQFQGGWQP